jgi:hypothetical protein
MTARDNHVCIDCILTTVQLIGKLREHNSPTCVGFIDCEKAFDRVDRNKL